MTNLNVKYAINNMVAAMKNAGASLQYTSTRFDENELSIALAEIAGKHISDLGRDISEEQRHDVHVAASRTHQLIQMSLEA